MGLGQALERVYLDLRRAIVPRLEFGQHRYERFLRPYVTPQTRWLDLGCGRKVLPDWRWRQERDLVRAGRMVVGVDCDLASLRQHSTIFQRVGGTIAHLPFQDGAFDLATANMVVEHLDRPERQFREVARILRPGGLFVLHTPNAGGYPTALVGLLPRRLRQWLTRRIEGAKEGDVFPTYYRANTARDVLRIARAAGFEPVEIEMIASPCHLAWVPPLALLELLWLRTLMTPSCRAIRSTMIVALRRRAPSAGDLSLP